MTLIPYHPTNLLLQVREEYPGTIMVDYTLPSVVNGERQLWSLDVLVCELSRLTQGPCACDPRQALSSPSYPSSLPPSAPGNATFYSENSVPFVMGTTGGDRDKIMREATESGVYAVIAPNMGKQVGLGWDVREVFMT